MKSLATILPGLLRDMGLEDPAKGWRAVTDWPALAGERIARRTRATAYRDGVLWVEVEGSAWMHELGYLKQELIGALNRELGGNRVRDIRLVVPRKGVLR